jgi:hypothetical protein
MRHLRGFAYLIIGLLLGINSVLAFAETQPASADTTPYSYRYQTGSTISTDTQLICKIYQQNSGMNGPSTPSVNPTTHVLTCSMFYSNGTTPFTATLSGTKICATGVDNGTACVTYTCPSGGGWSLSGSTCNRPDCVAPNIRKPSGLCGVPCPAAGSSSGSNDYSGSGTAPAYITNNGCRITCSTTISMGSQWASTGCKYNGQDATGNETPPAGETEKPADPLPPEQKKNPTTPQGCLAAGQSYITSSTGATTCIAPSDSPEPIKITDKSKTTDETGGTTDRRTETTCDGSNCKETTTETAPDGTSKTTSKEASIDKFCAENPTSSLCKEQDDPCKDNPDRLSCMKTGTPEEGEGLQTKPIGNSSITVVGLTSSASCPADLPLPLGMTFSFDPYCQFASALRPIIIAMAWLSSAFLLFGMN